MTNQITPLAAARRHLGLEDLRIRNSDRLDFHEVAVWTLVAMAEDVAGRELDAEYLNRMAYRHFDIETLERRRSDRLDFHQIFVGDLWDYLSEIADEA